MKQASTSPLYLSIIVPVYNEAESLEELCDQILHSVQGKWSCEVLLIDDGSKDSSWECIQRLSSQTSLIDIRGIKLRRNFGKATAMNVGFQAAQGQRIITMDADLQDDPKEISRFLDKIDSGYHVVSGWKKKRHDPLEKRLPSKLFNAITSIATNTQLHDMNCGFKAYRSEAVANLRIYGELHRFIPALLSAEGYSIGEIEVEHHARKFGSSKYGIRRYLSGFFDLITVVATTRFLQKPLHLFGASGLGIGGIGTIILLYLSFNKVVFGVDIQARPLFFFGILCVLFAGQLISVGVLAELLNHQTGKWDPAKFIECDSSATI